MKPINKTATKIMDRLVEGLGEPGTETAARKLDNAPGAFMALSVERIGQDLFSLAHYYEQNGDLVPDPDMVFWRGPDSRYYAVEITQGPVGIYRRAIEFENGTPVRCNPRLVAELASFAGMWLRNIKAQQF